MDLDILAKQVADLRVRVNALEGNAPPAHLSPEGVVQEMETAHLTEDRVKEIIAEHNQAARGAEPGGVATATTGMTGVSSQVAPGTMVRDTPPSGQSPSPFDSATQMPSGAVVQPERKIGAVELGAHADRNVTTTKK